MPFMIVFFVFFAFFALSFNLLILPRMLKMQAKRKQMREEEKLRRQQQKTLIEKEKLEREIMKQKLKQEAELEMKSRQPKACQYCGTLSTDDRCSACGAKIQ